MGETVLLVGHGSRVQESNAEIERLAKKLQRKIGIEVNIANMKTPVFYDEKMGELLRKSNKVIYIIPLFLFTGGFNSQNREGSV